MPPVAQIPSVSEVALVLGAHIQFKSELKLFLITCEISAGT